mgnify:CR=1 FL=1
MKVYFNNSCKICKAEIDLYKKEKIQEIEWIDITNNELAKKETSRNDKELLRRLHVKENEKVIEGAEAFLALWKKMPKYKFLYSFCSTNLETKKQLKNGGLKKEVKKIKNRVPDRPEISLCRNLSRSV